ncbi:MAG: DUF2252 family protein [Pseudomonadota bacterium]
MKTPTPDARHDLLIQRRNEKMARSPHAFVRGNTIRYYEWLQSHRGHALPKGPPIWICGDCHLGNLGPLADGAGNVTMQMRDFDQATIGNPLHDLVRLALSLATAARNSLLPGVVTARMLEHLLDGYAAAFSPDADTVKVAMPKVAQMAVMRANQRSWKHLARERIVDTTPSIPLGRNFWQLSVAEKEGIAALCQSPELIELVTLLKGRERDTPVRMLDAAYWVKGCSSLGLLRYAVLVGVGENDQCLIDIKEAVQASSPRYRRVSMPRDNARRVRTGAFSLAPALGERMLAQRFLGRGVVVRELMPQDLKLEIDMLSVDQATRTARYLAYVVGQAHAAQMDADTRRSFLADLRSSAGKTGAAPDWLWKSVVYLLASHEAGYLEHCRKYASQLKH